MNGTSGSDLLLGGSGTDILNGGGIVILSGGNGYDTLVYRLGENVGSIDLYDGGSG